MLISGILKKNVNLNDNSIGSLKRDYFCMMDTRVTIDESLELINPRERLRLFNNENRQIDSPFRIKADILDEFKKRARSIKLMTVDRRILNSKIIYFDDNFLYVRIPSGFRIEPKERVIVTFPVEKNNYILQTTVYQLKAPILCLKFLDPRKDRRYRAPDYHQILYGEIKNNHPLLVDKRLYIIRKTSIEDTSYTALNELIGRFDSFNERGDMVFRDLRHYSSGLSRGVLVNISRGGVMIETEGDDLNKQSLIYLETDIKLEGTLQLILRIFGYICNVNPNNTACIRFLKRIEVNSFEQILERWSTL